MIKFPSSIYSSSIVQLSNDWLHFLGCLICKHHYSNNGYNIKELSSFKQRLIKLFLTILNANYISHFSEFRFSVVSNYEKKILKFELQRLNFSDNQSMKKQCKDIKEIDPVTNTVLLSDLFWITIRISSHRVWWWCIFPY